MSWPKCRTRSYSVRLGYQLLCEARQQVHHQGLWMRELKDSGRVFGISRCQVRLKSSFGEHAQVHFLRRWGVGLHKRKIIDNKICDQCLLEIEDEVHVIWSCDCIQIV